MASTTTPTAPIRRSAIARSYQLACAQYGIVAPLSVSVIGKILKSTFPGLQHRRLGSRACSVWHCESGVMQSSAGAVPDSKLACPQTSVSRPLHRTKSICLGLCTMQWTLSVEHPFRLTNTLWAKLVCKLKTRITTKIPLSTALLSEFASVQRLRRRTPLTRTSAIGSRCGSFSSDGTPSRQNSISIVEVEQVLETLKINGRGVRAIANWPTGTNVAHVGLDDLARNTWAELEGSYQQQLDAFESLDFGTVSSLPRFLSNGCACL